jgi:thiamine biosynthesis protein ThiS
MEIGKDMILVNEEPLDWHVGMTVRDVLRARNYRFPMLIIHLDDVLVPKQAYDTATIPDGAVVKVIHLISGG